MTAMAVTAVLWLAIGTALLLIAQQASAEDMMLRDALTPDVLPVDPTQQMPTRLTLTRRPDGTLGLAEVPDTQKRPFKLQWYTQFDPSATQEFRDFVTGTIMPAAASLLGRFVRVRFPSGPLQFAGRVDEAGEPIPPGPLPDGAYDADVVVKVATAAEEDQRCDGVIAFAQPRLFETLTRRPTFGLIQFCSIEPEFGFAINMQTVVHELLHVLGFNSALYGTYFGFEGGLFDVAATSPGSPTSVDYNYDYSLGAFPALVPAVYTLDFERGGVSPAAGPASPGLLEGLTPGPYDPYSDNYYALFGLYDASPAPASGAPLQLLEYFYMEGGEPIRVRRPLLELLFGPAPEIGIITPNALREARLHFGCPEMETVLLQESFFGPTSHWNQRLYNGDVMRPSSSTRDVHFNRDAMTDLTLALLQDTGWYDVKYGSGGFNSYGYQGGCTFVNGTIEESLADPAAARYVCSLVEVGTTQCFHDFSGRGVCQGEFLLGYDDFYAVDVVRISPALVVTARAGYALMTLSPDY
eukprot:jgi/Ulvmu1/11429/UM076_0003.1